MRRFHFERRSVRIVKQYFEGTMPGTADGVQDGDVGQSQSGFGPPFITAQSITPIPMDYTLTGTGLSVDGSGNLVIQPGYWTVTLSGTATISGYDAGGVFFSLGVQSLYNAQVLYQGAEVELAADEAPLPTPINAASGQITAGVVTKVNPVLFQRGNPYGDDVAADWTLTDATADFTWTPAPAFRSMPMQPPVIPVGITKNLCERQIRLGSN